MKSLIKPTGLVVLFGLLVFFVAQTLFTQERQEIRPTRPPRTQDTTKAPEPVEKETYVSKVIISAPWGKTNLVYNGKESPPGEFGLHAMVIPDSLREELPAPPLPEGPTSFTVAPNGDIYITDPLNYRIQRFSTEGQLISVIPSIKIERYKWNLICVDPSKNVYLLCWEYDARQIVYKYDQTGKLVTAYPLFEEQGRGRGAGTRLFCDKSGQLFFESYKRIKKNNYVLSTFQLGTTEQVFPPEQQQKTEITKTPKNNEPDTIKSRAWEVAKSSNLWGPEMWNYDFVDEKGSYYLYWSTKQGITITKWYKQ
jgi:hypothetical protein